MKNVTKARIVIAFAMLLGLMHFWTGIVMSPPDPSDRIAFAVVIFVISALALRGLKNARLGLGILFSIIAVADLGFGMLYGWRAEFYGMPRLLFWGLITGAVGSVLLFWKDARAIEESNLKT